MTTKASAAALPGACGAVEQSTGNATKIVPQDEGAFTSRRRFLIAAVMAAWVKPERLTERVLQDVAEAESEAR